MLRTMMFVLSSFFLHTNRSCIELILGAPHHGWVVVLLLGRMIMIMFCCGKAREIPLLFSHRMTHKNENSLSPTHTYHPHSWSSIATVGELAMIFRVRNQTSDDEFFHPQISSLSRSLVSLSLNAEQEHFLVKMYEHQIY